MPESIVQAPFDVVAIASSAGGLRALHNVIDALPARFPAALVVVQHVHPRKPSQMATLLQQHTALHVKMVEEGDVICAGTVYIARPDWHFEVVAPGIAQLTQTLRVNFSRPSADPLFESIAVLYRERAIAIVLTGNGVDGSAGAGAVKAHGGIVIAQDPADAEYSGMPNAAVDTGCVDHVLPLRQITEKLIQLVMPGAHNHE